MPNGSIGEMILIDEYIDMIKNGVIGPDGKRLSKGIGHLLYEILRKLEVVKNSYFEALGHAQIAVIDAMKDIIKETSNELYSNP